jgi:hypothetical protein
MDHSLPTWLCLMAFGFVFGASSGPQALVRIGIGLMLLSGLGVVLASTSGHERLAYWFVIGMVGVVVTFLVAMLGALVGAAARKAFHRRVPGAERRASLRS